MTKTFTLKLFWIPILILGLFLLVLYILQVGALAQEEHLLQDYGGRLILLSKNKKFLDIDFSKMNSLSHIETYLLNDNFVKANQVKYIQILEGSVVSRPH